MKDRDREDDRERERDRDRDYERENGTNGEDRKGTHFSNLNDYTYPNAPTAADREEAAPAHDDLDTAE